MLAIARGELIQVFRNRLVLFSALVIPAGLGALLIFQRDTYAQLGSGMGFLATLLLMMVAGMSLYATSVTTLASRRQNLFMKRLRSTAAGDASILAGLVMPATVISLLQITVILGILGYTDEMPADVALLVAGVVGVVLMMLGFALATAGVTQSPEHAQVTTLPVIFGVVGVAIWVGATGTAEMTEVKRALPAGAATELIINAWNGAAELNENLFLLLPTVAWVVVAFVAAKAMFRWEPRR